MAVVSNTSPVLNLAIIDRLYLIQEQFGEVYIPQAVIQELRVNENLPGCQRLREAMDAGWLRVEEVSDSTTIQVLQRDLDRGEAEAIALALEFKAKWVLLDEREARKVAKNLGLRVTGVLGIMLRASRQGRFPSLRSEIEMLRDKAGFHIADQLLYELLEASRKVTGKTKSTERS